MCVWMACWWGKCTPPWNRNWYSCMCEYWSWQWQIRSVVAISIVIDHSTYTRSDCSYELEFWRWWWWSDMSVFTGLKTKNWHCNVADVTVMYDPLTIDSLPAIAPSLSCSYHVWVSMHYLFICIIVAASLNHMTSSAIFQLLMQSLTAHRPCHNSLSTHISSIHVQNHYKCYFI